MAISLKEARARWPGAETFSFGGDADPALNESLLALVRSGAKRATCQARSVYEAGGEAWPAIGRRDIALNPDGTPALVIETVSLEEWAFRDVPEDFALAEGENETLYGWRADHERWFRRTCGFSPDMVLVCERFRVVEDFA